VTGFAWSRGPVAARLEALLLALAIGTAGGAAARWLGLPLPWMIGAMAAAVVAAMAGAPIALPQGLRSVMVALLGVMLGSGFSPAILDQLADWALSLSTLAVYTAVAGAASMVFFQRVAGYDRTTAFFSAMPGGLSEMILVGSALGGDGRIISLVHSSRLLLVVFSLPVAFQLLVGYEPGSRPPAGPSLADIPGADLAILAGCGLAGFLGARALRLPAAAVVGPMVLSAAVHLAGWTAAKPPVELVAAAQVVVGSAIGCRFAGVSLALVGRTAVLAGGSTVILVAVAVGFALALHGATGLPIPALVLAYAPGGLAEMSLIALALSLDAAFVATHHLVRVFLIVVLAPTLFRARGRPGTG
jgi:membrane AbrB-like protein